MYPNPATGVFNLDLNAYPNPNGTVRVSDAYGKTIQLYKLNGSPVLQMEINGADGLYFISVEVDGMAPVTKRVVIAH